MPNLLKLSLFIIDQDVNGSIEALLQRNESLCPLDSTDVLDFIVENIPEVVAEPAPPAENIPQELALVRAPVLSDTGVR